MQQHQRQPQQQQHWERSGYEDEQQQHTSLSVHSSGIDTTNVSNMQQASLCKATCQQQHQLTGREDAEQQQLTSLSIGLSCIDACTVSATQQAELWKDTNMQQHQRQQLQQKQQRRMNNNDGATQKQFTSLDRGGVKEQQQPSPRQLEQLQQKHPSTAHKAQSLHIKRREQRNQELPACNYRDTRTVHNPQQRHMSRRGKHQEQIPQQQQREVVAGVLAHMLGVGAMAIAIMVGQQRRRTGTIPFINYTRQKQASLPTIHPAQALIIRAAAILLCACFAEANTHNHTQPMEIDKHSWRTLLVAAATALMTLKAHAASTACLVDCNCLQCNLQRYKKRFPTTYKPREPCGCQHCQQEHKRQRKQYGSKYKEKKDRDPICECRHCTQQLRHDKPPPPRWHQEGRHVPDWVGRSPTPAQRRISRKCSAYKLSHAIAHARTKQLTAGRTSARHSKQTLQYTRARAMDDAVHGKPQRRMKKGTLYANLFLAALGNKHAPNSKLKHANSPSTQCPCR
ncbi:hypothetical protein COO60DRAFT_1672859, partial [Scenedesmus sp. NREL 46B-D3]